MKVFDQYAHYYELLYKDKNYEAEAGYIKSLIKKFKPDAKDIFEFGCGTGNHAMLLVQRGYTVFGIDLSEEMLAQAHKKIEQDKELSSNLSFACADLRNVRVAKKFDIVIALFHVMSYQTTNQDLIQAFESASRHLKKDGIFIFDCWYGPAVMHDIPKVKIKCLEDEKIKVIRITEPGIFYNENKVDVKFTLFVEDKKSKNITTLHEDHLMRYLFKPEIENIMNATGFDLIHSEEWLTSNPISHLTWGACFVGQKK